MFRLLLDSLTRLVTYIIGGIAVYLDGSVKLPSTSRKGICNPQIIGGKVVGNSLGGVIVRR